MRGTAISTPKTRLNDEITSTQVRLIDADGQQQGVVELAQARAMAQSAGLDLVEVSPNAKPPVVRIMNWGKFNYQKIKQAQKAKKKQKSQSLKQVRFGVKIGQHDLEVKLKRIQEFLTHDHKVKMSVFFRGREITHQELGYELLTRVVGALGDEIVVEQTPELTGKYLSTVVRKK